MARALTTAFKLGITTQYSDTQSGVGETGATVSQANGGLLIQSTFASGTSSGQAQRTWSSMNRTLTGSADETFDMYDLASLDIGHGAGLDAMGESTTYSVIKGLLIRNQSTSTGTLLVGGDGTTAAWNSLFSADDDGTLALLPGDAFCYMSSTGASVADTTNHLLKILASGGAVTYDIVVVGLD